MYTYLVCGPFVQLISREISQAPSSLTFSTQDSRLDTRNYRGSSIESRGSRIEAGGTVNLLLSSIVISFSRRECLAEKTHGFAVLGQDCTNTFQGSISFDDGWLVWVIVDELHCSGNVVLDGVQFLLHITGPYKMAVALQQTTHEVGLLGQIGDECGHKIHSSQQTLSFLLIGWRSKCGDGFQFLWT